MCGLNRRSGVQVFKLTRDNQFIKDLIEAENEFWKMVEDRTPPPIDGTNASSELIKGFIRKRKGRKFNCHAIQHTSSATI